MGLDIWFREDIANAIMAADQACAATAAMIEELHSDKIQLRAYRRGYQAALTTVALAFGILIVQQLDRPAWDDATKTVVLP